MVTFQPQKKEEKKDRIGKHLLLFEHVTSFVIKDLIIVDNIALLLIFSLSDTQLIFLLDFDQIQRLHE